jgi:hypothetical protein
VHRPGAALQLTHHGSDHLRHRGADARALERERRSIIAETPPFMFTRP